jgi:3-hydroxybutyryl-CoA dehydrogenase
MKIVVSGNENEIAELTSGCTSDSITLINTGTTGEFMLHTDADAFFDLAFENTAERTALLTRLLPKPVFINSVIEPFAEKGSSFIRINGWPTFLKRTMIEASCSNESLKPAAEKISAALNKTIDWVPDIPGFVSARVVSMIINEAYFALQENVSTKEEIDVAMKLGTNYPYGPFEWSEKIGLKNIYSLLKELSKTNLRYQPAALLEKEANK